MWHEDILAWQQARETVVLSPVAVSTAFQLCIQDPTRVILILTVAGSFGANIGTDPAVLAAGGGIPLGVGPTNDETIVQISTTPVEYNRVLSNSGPAVFTLRWPRDGLLPKLAWWAIALTATLPMGVIEVTMQERPCPTWRIPNGALRSGMRVQGGNQSVGRGGHEFDPLAWPQCAPARADLLPDES